LCEKNVPELSFNDCINEIFGMMRAAMAPAEPCRVHSAEINVNMYFFQELIRSYRLRSSSFSHSSLLISIPGSAAFLNGQDEGVGF
jgi:hypothetical protein